MKVFIVFFQTKKNLFFFFFWPCVACGILVPRPGIKPIPPAVEVQSLNHWTTREVPLEAFSTLQADLKIHLQMTQYYHNFMMFHFQALSIDLPIWRTRIQRSFTPPPPIDKHHSSIFLKQVDCNFAQINISFQITNNMEIPFTAKSYHFS